MFATMQKKIRMPAMPRLLVPRNSPTSFVFSGLYLVALPSPPPPQLVLRNFATGRATASDLSSPFPGPVHAPCNSSPDLPLVSILTAHILPSPAPFRRERLTIAQHRTLLARLGTHRAHPRQILCPTATDWPETWHAPPPPC